MNLTEYTTIEHFENHTLQAEYLLKKLGIKRPSKRQLDMTKRALDGEPICGNFLSDSMEGALHSNSVASRIVSLVREKKFRKSA